MKIIVGQLRQENTEMRHRLRQAESRYAIFTKKVLKNSEKCSYEYQFEVKKKNALIKYFLKYYEIKKNYIIYKKIILYYII